MTITCKGRNYGNLTCETTNRGYKGLLGLGAVLAALFGLDAQLGPTCVAE